MTPGSEGDVWVKDGLTIPADELTFRFSRSGAPGGQKVNRSATRVELLFDVSQSPSLSEFQRHRILKRLSSYVDGEGVLRLVSQTTRSQMRNRGDVLSRFRRLLRQSLCVQRRRIPTKPSKGSVERRLEAKRKASLRKKRRGPVTRDEW